MHPGGLQVGLLVPQRRAEYPDDARLLAIRQGVCQCGNHLKLELGMAAMALAELEQAQTPKQGAKPDAKDINDLRGKVFGVITKGASSDHAAIALFKRYGIRYGQDVKILYFARQGDLLASLQKGIVSAGVFSSPTTVMAKRLGFKKLVDIASFKYPYPHNAIATRKSLIRQNPELIKGFLKAYLASIKIIHEQPEFAKKALADFLGTKDPEMIDDSYQSLADLFLKVPYMPEEAIRTVLSLSDNPKAASANPKDFYDNSLLKELEDSGFVKELYSR